MDGIVVIGEGEKDEAPMLFNGEPSATATRRPCDIAVDPIDGTTLTAKGRGNALAVIAAERARHHVQPRPVRLHGEDRRRPRVPSASIDITESVTENIEAVAKAKGESVRDVTVVILDRDRHDALIDEVRATGARIRLIPDGDVAGAISTAWPDSGADILVRHRRHARGRHRRRRAEVHGRRDPGSPVRPQRRRARRGRRRRATTSSEVLDTDDLVRGDNCFFAATGITDGELLKGVHYDDRGCTTQSLVMRSKSGTVRLVNARHNSQKLSAFSKIGFD